MGWTRNPIDLDLVKDMLSEGMTRAEIAKKLRVCVKRLGREARHLPIAYKAGSRPDPGNLNAAREANARLAAQRRRFVTDLANRGFTKKQIALALGISASAVFRALVANQERSIDERRAGTAADHRVVVPGWVPDYLHDTYRLVGLKLGEEEAASRCRRLKAEAARACL
jgi:predicted transcriptional regulator